MHSIEKKIIDAIVRSGESELAVVFNSSYETKKSKLVYVSVEQDKKEQEQQLVFYIKASSEGSAGVTVEGSVLETKGLIQKQVIEGYTTKLCDRIYSHELFGYQYDLKPIDDGKGYFSADDVFVSVNSDLKLLILESVLYSVGKKISSEDYNGSSVRFTNATLNTMELNRLRSSFTYNSYIRFRSLLNHKVSKKIVNRLLTANKFYKIYKVFIPVFINIKDIYNPLLDNPDNVAVRNSALYKIAVEDKNRFLDLGGQLSAYMVTHKEICKAFHLNRFVRFSPLAAYDLFVGLLLPDCSVFPNMSSESFIAPKSVILPDDYKKYYTMDTFRAKYQELRALVDKAKENNDEKAEAIANERLELLAQYNRGSSLLMYCHKELNNFTSFAALPIDSKVSADTLYTYLCDIRL